MKHIIRAKSLPPAPEVTNLCIEACAADQRLDNFLMRHLKGVPKTHIYRIIRSGEVRINKGRARADTRLAIGDCVRLPPVRVSERVAAKGRAKNHAITQATETSKPARDIAILFEDEHLIAINKPAGLAVHGGSGVSFGVIEQMRMVRSQAPFLELVHRLDRDTSGVLLLAKKRSALNHLQDQFRQRQTGKTYLALVRGQWPAGLTVLDQPLHKYLCTTPETPDGERRVRVVARDNPDGMTAMTLIGVVASSPDYSLLQVTLKTGRTHQIRVHLAHAGHPIAGDDKYGDFEWNKSITHLPAGVVETAVGLRRMFLHAYRLQFDHPVSHERHELLAKLPAELERFAETVLGAAARAR